MARVEISEMLFDFPRNDEKLAPSLRAIFHAGEGWVDVDFEDRFEGRGTETVPSLQSTQ